MYYTIFVFDSHVQSIKYFDKCIEEEHLCLLGDDTYTRSKIGEQNSTPDYYKEDYLKTFR